MWIDVSHPISPRTAVWPGDRRFSCGWTMALARGDSVNVGELGMSVHTGTHVDAYLHFDEDGWDAARMPLDLYAGPCIVIHVPTTRAVLPAHIAGVDFAKYPRVLFKTRLATHADVFDEGLTSIAPETARALVEAGVKLVGTDAASVDAFDSKTLETHKILAAGGAGILENVALAGVGAGAYELFAFPLKLEGMDGSPVRAVIRRI